MEAVTRAVSISPGIWQLDLCLGQRAVRAISRCSADLLARVSMLSMCMPHCHGSHRIIAVIIKGHSSELTSRHTAGGMQHIWHEACSTYGMRHAAHTA